MLVLFGDVCFISVDMQTLKRACTVLLKTPCYSTVCHHMMLQLGSGGMSAAVTIRPISSKTTNPHWHGTHSLTQVFQHLSDYDRTHDFFSKTSQ
jgi:hypothetical protein